MRDIFDRLSESRDGLGLSQKAMAQRCGVSLRSQQNYESGERLPDAAYLAAAAAAGADIRYIVTGQRDGPAPVVLSAEEQLLLGYFRESSKELRKAALGVLLSGTPATRIGGTHSQHASGDGSIQVGSMGSKVTKRRG